MPPSVEQDLRTAAIDWLHQQNRELGYVRRVDALGFTADGRPLPLVDMSRGIRNAADFTATLSLTVRAHGPGDGLVWDGDLLRFDYERGSAGRSNRKVRVAMTARTPLILFLRVRTGVLAGVAPVRVAEDDPEDEAFWLRIDAAAGQDGPRQLVHRMVFRARVLHAYGSRCAVCGRVGGSQVDAVRVDPAATDPSAALVPNAVALCGPHRAAFDLDLFAVGPDDGRLHLDPGRVARVEDPVVREAVRDLDGRVPIQPGRSLFRTDRHRLVRRWERFAGQ